MRLQLAQECLRTSVIEERLAAIPLLADSPAPEADYLLTNCVADPAPSVWNRSRDTLLYRHPWLALEAAVPRPVPDSARFAPLSEGWASLRQGIQRVMEENELPLDSPARVLELPAWLPDWVEIAKALGRRRFAVQIEQLQSRVDVQHERQILLAPTYRCNLACSYCYSRGFGDSMPADLSLGDLNYFFSWAATQGIATVLLAGGEPTLYIHLPELLRLASESKITVRLTTNGMYSAAVRELIRQSTIFELVAHYDQEVMASSSDAAERFEQNLRAARSAGIPVILRYTLSESSDSGEWCALMDLAVRLGIEQLNYAFAFQGSAGLNAHVPMQAQVGRPGGHIDITLNQLCADAGRRGLRLHLSKPFPLCTLSVESLRLMLQSGGLRPACVIHHDGYTRNLTINPDLTTFPCNGIPIPGPGIRTVDGIADAGAQCARQIETLLFRPWAEPCRDCALWYRGVCRGACQAENYLQAKQETAAGALTSIHLSSPAGGQRGADHDL